MADSAKAQKLAAARKMLKQYQQKTQSSKSQKNDGDSSKNVQKIQSDVSENNTRDTTPVSFTTNEDKEERIEEQNALNVENFEVLTNSETITDNKNSETFFNNSLFQDNNRYVDYFDSFSQNAKPVDCCVNDFAIAASLTEAKHSEEMIKNEIQQGTISAPTEITFGNQDENMSESVTDTKIVESALENNLLNDISKNFDAKSISNAESLRQLSLQINSVIEKEFDTGPGEYSQLEHRNQELAALLDSEKLKNEKLNLQLREYLSRITQLELEVQQSRNEADIKLEKEVGPLQEQLQYHIQTVGILVGEKTELTMALNQSQQTAKQKISECEELQSRLKASRHRVSDLEKEVTLLRSTKPALESTNTPEYEKMRSELQSFKEQLEEVTEESNEIKQKLNVRTNECMALQKELHEKNSQLSLMELRVQQLSTDENLQAQSELEMLSKQKFSLEQQVADLTQAVRTMGAERSQANQQYQQYVQQLNAQLESLAERLERTASENETLASREESLLGHVAELEKRLQQLRVEKDSVPVASSQENAELRQLASDKEALADRLTEVENKFHDETKLHESLKNKAKEMQFRIEELQGVIEQLRSDRPDASRLLAAMESDKVAASRAIDQNNRLKTQVEELTEAFVQMSNSKLELTEKWESEKHRAQELSLRVEHVESERDKLLTAIKYKDAELLELQGQSERYDKEILQQNQVIDRLRHYEAQGNVSDIIEQELKHANEEIERLTAENVKLNVHGHQQQRHTNELAVNETIVVDNSQADVTATGDDNPELQAASEEAGQAQHYLDRERAMEQLEERFKRTMAEVANLTEEKQRLEHLVLQLQGETETIGEYVTLYQCQRALLKQKTQEKDEQLQRLAHDRQEMKLKLEDLNGLVRQLMQEKSSAVEALQPAEAHQHPHGHDCNKLNGEPHAPGDAGDTSDSINNNQVGQQIDTTKKIFALITEIKASSLVQATDGVHSFHPCPWCSGQLITV